MESYRFYVFKQNLGQISLLEAEQKGVVFQVNKFADITFEEFAATYLQSSGAQHQSPDQAPSSSGPGLKSEEVINDIPVEWDWTAHGAVTHIKDQGECGSCWTFSTVGTLEGQHAIKKKELLVLAEQQLVDCDKSNYGCDGGLMTKALKWLMNNGGVMSEADYPYKAKQGTCQFDESKVKVKVGSYANVQKGSEVEMRQALYQKGPLASGVYCGNAMQFYKSGIFEPVYCPGLLWNHGVVTVGYGSDNGKAFWKVKNSFGTEWGEQGFFRILRGKDKCGIESYTTYAEII